MSSNKRTLPADWTPTGTAWKTASGELVQIYRQGTSRWVWGCGGCLNSGLPDATEMSRDLYKSAQEHAHACSAIQV
jgi:hypothetical protein